MDSVEAPRPHHRRNKSATILKSIITSTSKNHKRTPSDGTTLKALKSSENTPLTTASTYDRLTSPVIPFLPADHPHNRQRVLGEICLPNTNASPDKQTKDSRPKGLHKKTLSSVSLRSMGKAQDVGSPEKSPKKSRRGDAKDTEGKPKRPKSSTNLAALFSKGKSKDKEEAYAPPPEDKENTTPPKSCVSPPMHTPIWAQFSSNAFQESTTTTSVPLNDRSFNEEIALYTPSHYSPGKQRNFHDMQRPTLEKRSGSRSRPQSQHIPHSLSSNSFIESLSRKLSNEKPLPQVRDDIMTPNGNVQEKRRSWVQKTMSRTNSTDDYKVVSEKPKDSINVPKKDSRVKAAVAAFNGKAKEAEMDSKLDAKKVDAAFEAVLVS